MRKSISITSGFFRWLSAAPVLAVLAGAAEEGWDVRLAKKFSGRLKAIEGELAGLAPKLETLPRIPIDDQGGTGGYAGIYPKPAPERDEKFAVEIRWPDKAAVDFIALVPTRRYDAEGLDAQYGTPEEFSVELLDAAGKVIAEIARERNVHRHPVRRGHPFVYPLARAVDASGLRISALRLHPDAEEAESYVHAWAEAFVFAGDRNIAQSAEVRSLGGATPPTPWHWQTAYLVDGQTPLGLPEVPAEEHGNIGWLSNGRDSADEAASLVVDLGNSAEIDSVRLLPAKKPTSDLPSGFGFPRKLGISVSGTGEPGEAGNWRNVATREFLNPGHNPVSISFPPTTGRFIRVDAIKLWKAFETYPAFFALSEVEIISREKNLAEGRPVRSSDGMLNLIGPGGRFWSGAALSDGFGPDGRLVSTRVWLTRLDERLKLETLRHELLAEADRVIAGWRRAGLIGFAILGLAGAFAIIALPIRYRIHANRELLKVRERIAGDLHDEVGSNLGSIQMFADLAEGRSGPSAELKRIQRIAAETVSAVRDIVWLLRPGGEHRIATVEHLRETSSIMLEALSWKFSANEEAWQVELPDEETRHLFLFFREALHNILRHAKAEKVAIRVDATEGSFQLAISDDGIGIDPQKLERASTLRALRQRTSALNADLKVETRPGQGTRLVLTVPLVRKRPRKSKACPASPPET